MRDNTIRRDESDNTYLRPTPPKTAKKNIAHERLLGFRKSPSSNNLRTGKHATQKQSNGAFGKQSA